jgi:hypothetical protein
MLIHIFSSVREWGPYALASASFGGLVVGCFVRSLKVRLWLGFGSSFGTVLLIVGLYWMLSSTAFPASTRSAMLYPLLYAVGFAIFPICFALGTFLGSMIAGIRRAIDRWVTPQIGDAA